MSSEPSESEVPSLSAPDLKVAGLKKTAGLRRAKEAGGLQGKLVNRSAVLMEAHSTVACRQNTCNQAADIKEADTSVQL